MGEATSPSRERALLETAASVAARRDGEANLSDRVEATILLVHPRELESQSLLRRLVRHLLF